MLPAFVAVALGANATHALVISQVVLSMALPLPVISLLIFTRRPDIMGRFANSSLTRWAALVATAVVLTLNAFFGTAHARRGDTRPVNPMTPSRAIAFGLAAAIASAFGASSQAADSAGQMPLKAPPAVAAPYDWTGVYLGGHTGYSRGQSGNTLFDPDPAGLGGSFGSLYGGLQIGYNFLLPSRLLIGLEGDISFANFFENNDVAAMRSTMQGTLVADRIDYVASLRGRFGYAFDRLMIYATGGLAWSQARLTETPGVVNDEDKVLRTRIGWAAGWGGEVAIAPDWTARLEYLYERFGSVTAMFPSGTRYQSTFDIHALRLGLNHQLRWPDAGTPASSTDGAWPIASDDWNIHGQSTFIEQGYPAFRSPYQGANSLSGASQAKNTMSATAFVGWRPRDGTEIYVNPELMQGFGLSDTLGLAGFPNGEAQKSNFALPRVNVARVFLRQTFGLGGEQEAIEDGPNQLPGKQDISRITVTAGKFAVTDFFDANSYAHDPRANFLNWNMYCCGSYDWAMDKISYTWGAMAELNQKSWAVRAGYFLVPVVSNDNRYDGHVLERGQYIGEFEWRYSLLSQPGKLRLMGWANIANAGSYAEAVALPITSPSYPDITLTRQVRTNYGFVVNVEQAITDDLGVFSRVSWDAGQTEKIGWTDCDQSFSLGAVLKGTSWGRPNDKVGVGGVVEGLSPDARAYFAAGGLGILIGDGRLNYQPEKILEAYYAYSVNKWVTVSLDYQFVADPAYNADRGPVSILAARLHAEF
jgi:high affinity Mn2+ porin